MHPGCRSLSEDDGGSWARAENGGPSRLRTHPGCRAVKKEPMDLPDLGGCLPLPAGQLQGQSRDIAVVGRTAAPSSRQQQAGLPAWPRTLAESRVVPTATDLTDVLLAVTTRWFRDPGSLEPGGRRVLLQIWRVDCLKEIASPHPKLTAASYARGCGVGARCRRDAPAPSARPHRWGVSPFGHGRVGRLSLSDFSSRIGAGSSLRDLTPSWRELGGQPVDGHRRSLRAARSASVTGAPGTYLVAYRRASRLSLRKGR